MKLIFKQILALTCLVLVEAQVEDYYWRDYHGTIPYDALPAVDNDTLYIAQGFARVNNVTGTVPTGLRPDTELILLPIGANGTTVRFNTVRILCSPTPANLNWVSTKSTTFIVDVIDKNPILGGRQLDDANTQYLNYVGRYNVNGSYIVGRIQASTTSVAFFYIDASGALTYSTTFESLVYELQ